MLFIVHIYRTLVRQLTYCGLTYNSDRRRRRKGGVFYSVFQQGPSDLRHILGIGTSAGISGRVV